MSSWRRLAPALEARRAADETIAKRSGAGHAWRAMLAAVSDLIALRDRMRAFTEERDWGQFHDPKSLILALVGEVGELAELFQWLPADKAVERVAAEPLKTRVGEEMADVLLYLVRLADVLGVDLGPVAEQKLSAGQARFPSRDFRGRAPEKR